MTTSAKPGRPWRTGQPPRRGAGGPTGVLLSMISARRPPKWSASPGAIVMLLLRIAGAALIAVIGYIHYFLWWIEKYRFLPTNGPLFLLDVIAAALFVVALLAWPRPLIGLLAAGFAATTMGALLISHYVGLFGLQESFSANYAVESLFVESIAVVVLLAWSATAAVQVARSR